MPKATPIIEVQGLGNYLGSTWVHRDLNFNVYPGEIVGVIGGSGSGKTTLLRSLLMLVRPQEGSIKIFGINIMDCSPEETLQVRYRWGVMFQQSALFSSLTVLENILFPLRVFTELSPELQKEIALLKISLAGLSVQDVANKYPSELSGGMKKRAALARAIALDPELLFLDEPTSGLDPASADDFDHLVLELSRNLKLTLVLVTHDLDSLWNVTDRVAFLANGKVVTEEPIKDLVKHNNPLIKNYFSGERGKARERWGTVG